MSKETSNATREAMRDNDRHSAGSPGSDVKDTNAELKGKEHTRPQGDLRDVADKEDSHNAFRGEINRGH
jgi:hypothetical protein